MKDEESDKSLDLDTLRHSASHIMAEAVRELYPELKLAIGPPIEDGFYYDFLKKEPFTPEDLEKIEKKMKSIIEADYPFICKEMSRKEAIDYFERMNEPFKVELLKELDSDTVTIYQQGNFVDLCRGPHIPSTGKLSFFKLLSVAGAYWRGNEQNPMLQRIYGTAFLDEKSLKSYLERLEESKRRDHRKLGRELDLFTIHEDAGAGLVYWHPKGALVRRIIEDFWKDEHARRGYQIINIPHIARINLWEKSGHTQFYKENMYFMEIDNQKYVLKPMNCPGHIMIYQTKVRSYRDLPVRYAELGTVYRYERSGVLHGLLRVRGFTQDDAHIFCAPEQINDEITNVIDLADYMLKNFGYNEFEIDLSVRDPAHKDKYMGSDEEWNMAEEALIKALKSRNLSYTRKEGEAVFYGPKIDIKLLDALGRTWQGPTIQFDFNLPIRFDVKFINKDGKAYHVFMIHRTVLGSMERFFGGLIEHYGGAFPAWLAPVQVKVLPISEKQLKYAKDVVEKLSGENIRVEMDDRNEKIGFKIREAQLEKIPYMLIIGSKEVEGSKVSLRKRNGEDKGAVNLSDFMGELKKEIELRKNKLEVMG